MNHRTSLIKTDKLLLLCRTTITSNTIRFACNFVNVVIGGFRDTYLGRQVVSSPERGRGQHSAGSLGERCELLKRGLGSDG